MAQMIPDGMVKDQLLAERINIEEYSSRERCNGIMGVPITFLDKWNPDQFTIVGCSYDYGRPDGWSKEINMAPIVEGKNIYKRILIKRRKHEN
ncbi:hypothetical protein IIZ81_01370 [Candidatus Saccharibacteria bacterium]|nr:hypothetical protein [Candidatus Saccharibacteria bacterium]